MKTPLASKTTAFLGVSEKEIQTTKKHDNIITIKARTTGVASAIL